MIPSATKNGSLKTWSFLRTPDSGDPAERGFADVWKKGCFGWEYKGKKKDLDQAYKQLLRYREALLNPPLLVVCDFDRYIVKTNFNGRSKKPTSSPTKRLTSRRIGRFSAPYSRTLIPSSRNALPPKSPKLSPARLPKSPARFRVAKPPNWQMQRAAPKSPLPKGKTCASRVFSIASSSASLPRTPAFCPKKLFSGILKDSLHNPRNLTEVVEQLFHVMATGGLFGPHRIRHFNGHLFEESTVFELTEDEIAKLAEAAEADWQFIQPSIMGNLFERGLDPDQRAQLGAHYTSEADILTLVEPVLMAPVRREWAQIKSELARAFKNGKGTLAQRKRLASFLTKVAHTTVLDPACGSGNFLYVSLRLLLDLEKEVIAFAHPARLPIRADG